MKNFFKIAILILYFACFIAGIYLFIDSMQPYPNEMLRERLINYNAPRIFIITPKPIVIHSELHIATNHVLVVGDSEAGFLWRKLRNMSFPNMTVSTEYIGGTVIDRWSKYGEFHNAMTRHPDTNTVVILLGTNSYWRKELPNLQPILNEIGNKECYWLGPTRVHNKVWQFNLMLRDAIEEDGRCKYIDLEELNPPLEDDEIHFKDPDGILKVIDAVPIWSKK